MEELSRALGIQELEILRRLGSRLLEGQRVYGLLDLAKDQRDLDEERAAEHADAAIYGEMAALRDVLRHRKEASRAALRKLARRKGRR